MRCGSCGFGVVGSRWIERRSWGRGGAGLAALTVVVVEWSAAEQAVLDRGVPVPAEPSISLRGDDGTAPGVDWGWPELSDPAAMMNSCLRPGLAGVVRPCCDDELMSSTATSGAAVVSPAERVEVLFEELAELAGQRNAIDGRIVEIVAELDRDGLWGVTGARSVAGLVAWKMGCSPANAHTIATVARRLPEFPRCARAHDRHGGAAVAGVSALRPRYAGGAVVVGSGWGDRGARG